MGTPAKLSLAALLALTLPLGCQNQSIQTTVHQINGTKAERIAKLERVIEAPIELPSPIEDGHLIEQPLGDNSLGPTNYVTRIWIKVSPDNVYKMANRST